LFGECNALRDEAKDTINILNQIARQIAAGSHPLRREWQIVLQNPYRRVIIYGDLGNRKFQLVGKTGWIDGMKVLERLAEVDQRYATLLAKPKGITSHKDGRISMDDYAD